MQEGWFPGRPMGRLIENIHKRIRPILSNRTYASDDERYLFLILCLATAFCALVHILWLFVYVFSAMSILIFLNLFSLFVYSLCVIFIRKGFYTLCGVFISLEVIFYTLITSYFMGADTYIVFYYVLVLIMQGIIPYGSFYTRSAVVIVLWGSILASVFGTSFQEAKIYVENIRFLVAIVNVHVLIIGTLVELTAGNIVRDIVNAYNVVRMGELEDQAYTDPLTGLYNRRYASRLFQNLLPVDERVRYCVASLDIDDFKLVNDQHGHGVGDEVLKALADLMKSSLRRSDVIFRWGGEEFLILLDDTDLPTAQFVMEKLRGEIEKLVVRAKNFSLSVTVTIGVSELDPNETEESIKRSDERLYYGKNQGKNQVVAESPPSFSFS